MTIDPLTIKAQHETEIIREQVKRAIRYVMALNGSPGARYAINPTRHAVIQGLGEALGLIQRANEARDKSRKLYVEMQVPDLSKEVCRGLLEIGFDTGSNALALCFDGGPAELRTLVNPFRRESTTVQEPPDIRQHKGPFGKGAPVTPPSACTCGYDHGDLGSDGLCVRCGGAVLA